MEQCSLHTDIAVEVSEVRTKTDRNEKDVDAVWTVIRTIQEDIKKVLVKIAYIVGGIAVLQTVAVFLMDYFKKG
jgi:hypothetical protein